GLNNAAEIFRGAALQFTEAARKPNLTQPTHDQYTQLAVNAQAQADSLAGEIEDCYRKYPSMCCSNLVKRPGYNDEFYQWCIAHLPAGNDYCCNHSGGHVKGSGCE